MLNSKAKTFKKVLAFAIAIMFAATMAGVSGTGAVYAKKATKPKSITLKLSQNVVAPGETIKVSVASVTPAKASKKVTWKSSNKKIAKVSKKGTITGVKAGTVKITAKSKVKKKVKKSITVTVGNVLNGWVMTGYYDAAKINNTTIAANAELQVWDSAKRDFVAGTNNAASVLGNYVQLVDLDADKAADLIQVVKYADGPDYWDADCQWIKGAGINGSEDLDDETGAEMYAAEYRIPLGERLLANYGLGGYSGTTDWANYDDSPYYIYNDQDIYNTTSSDSLSILTNYKTELQTTGSTCVMSSALSALEWYGQRGDLNERDLSSLRGEDRAGKVGGTSITELRTVFSNLEDLGLTCGWNMEGCIDENTKDAGLEDGLWSVVKDGDDYIPWVQYQIQQGHPVILIWNSFGAHGQVIIGYDDMGTEAQSDDTLIIMDPYDTTDQKNDGYNIQSYWRLRDGKLTWSYPGAADKTTGVQFLAVWPKEGTAPAPVMGKGIPDKFKNYSPMKDWNKIPYGNTAADIQSFYPTTPIYDPVSGLSGPAGVERSGDRNYSPYYPNFDFFGTEDEVRENVGSDTLKIIDNYETIQQSTEWACGCASALSVINHFGMNEERTGEDPGAGKLETDVSLGSHRQIPDGGTIGKAGVTYRSGMEEIFSYMEKQYDQDWAVFTNMDLDDPYGEESYIGDYCLQAGDAYEDWYGLIPYLIDHNIPMMVGWDEWGGHWQVIIGYDGMGTEGTQDDVLILMDPYDDTDHNQDGYYLEGFERLVYGWDSAFEKKDPAIDGDEGANTFIVAFPATREYKKVMEDLQVQ